MSEILNTLMQDARVWQGQHHIRTRQLAESTGYQVLDNQLGGTGWPRGALSECLLDESGIGELHLLLPLIQRLVDTGKLPALTSHRAGDGLARKTGRP